MAGTLFDAIDRRAAASAGRPAIVSERGIITFGDLRRNVRALAALLAGRGVRPGDRVGLMLRNSPEFVIAYLATLAAGAIVVPLNDRYTQQEVHGFVETCGVSLLIAEESFPEWRELNREIDWDPPAVDPDSPVMYQFSSGSTGRPKRIARTHRQLLFELESLAATLGFGADDRFIGLAPFSHVNGMVRTMLSSLYAGAALYPVGRFDRRSVAALVARERITVFIAVPFMFIALAETPFRPAPDWSALRLCISASAPLPARHNRAFHARFGCYLRQLYGSTETGTISVNLDPDIEGTLESLGRPIRGVTVSIIGDDGQPVDTDRLGQIVVNESFVTGDLGRFDHRGMLSLHGRISSFINRGGFKVDPREVEELLEEHPAVREAAVYGVPTPLGDERVQALVVLRAPCTPHELATHVAGRLADFKIPSAIEICRELPKSPTGKLLRAQLGHST